MKTTELKQVSPKFSIRQNLVSLAFATVIGLGVMSSPVAAQQGEAPKPAVVVEPVTTQVVEEERIFAGRTEAISRVDLIARVGGFLEPLKFKEGQSVKKGDVLFVIRQDPYQFAVEQAQANLESAQAQVDLAKLDFDRKQRLVDRDTVAVSELDVARANLKEAEAARSLREADLELAKLDLSYTEILAPTDGIIGSATFKEGAYVTAASGTLATVTSMDPIRVTFPVPQDLIIRSQRNNYESTENLVLRIRLSDGEFYEHEGRLEFLEATANPGTDTVTARAQFPNPDRMLFDRQLVDVVASPKDAEPQLVISQAAMLLDQEGSFVLVVNDKGEVEQKRITIGEQVSGLVIVRSGLEEGDQVITSGIQKVRPGQVVDARLAGQS
ncbi:efflux RND transporter periplasmic adaptor subunit [Pseudovibrio exalbescens]|uniref:efflux RND transporter periplasmic adaptor subunit n=1 Tax=Pseudovibrio exalbescens TaxID=197461 RepID=UPI0023653F7C|nr:efflux RND transporter periplasmic adaptor subunit [Pseudovibrio exalbescens]MDD7909913.1 efflux RND transporter periplasmic adaptor subunit [Pseudovibrio exalbescens]